MKYLNKKFSIQSGFGKGKNLVSSCCSSSYKIEYRSNKEIITCLKCRKECQIVELLNETK